MASPYDTNQSPNTEANLPARSDEITAASVPDFIDRDCIDPVPPAAPLFGDDTALPETVDNAAGEPPDAVERLFAKPPTLPREDREAYQALQKAFHAAVQPRDLLESIWLYDLTHLTWEIERGRRRRKDLLKGTRPEAIRAMIRVRIDTGVADRAGFELMAARLAQNSYTNGYDGVRGFDISEDEVMAQAYRQLYRELDALERQIAGWESRRNKLLRDLEARREKQEARA